MVPRLVGSAPSPQGGARRVELGELDEEITAVHGGELEQRPTLPPLPSIPRDERTMVLAADELVPGPGPAREETTVLDPSSLSPSDGGWATVVLPGGGHPDYVAERTQLLAADDEDDEDEAAQTLQRGMPTPVALDSTDALPGMGGTKLHPAPTLPRSSTIPALTVLRPPSEAVPPVWPTVPGGYPPVAAPPPGGQPAAAVTTSGDPPIVGTPLARSHPVVPPRSRGPTRRAPRGGSPITGAHPHLAARPDRDDGTRLAWGFLMGVLIAIAVIGGAVAVVMLVLR